MQIMTSILPRNSPYFILCSFTLRLWLLHLVVVYLSPSPSISFFTFFLVRCYFCRKQLLAGIDIYAGLFGILGPYILLDFGFSKFSY